MGASMTLSGRLRGFDEGAREFDDQPLEVQGRLPDWLRGSLLLNGPACWALPGGGLRHWFDGYAMLHRLHFGGGRPVYRSRWLQSHVFRQSRSSGRPAKGEFGSPNPLPWWRRLMRNDGTDNAAVTLTPHGSSWLAATETPFLWHIDPDTLDTRDAVLLNEGPGGVQAMSAHGATLADGSFLTVGTAFGRTHEQRLLLLKPGAQQAEVIARVPMREVGYTHGFALAPGHAILWECALRAKPLAMRFGGRAYCENFEWRPGGGSRLHAVPLDGGAVRSWDIPPMMTFHAAQAWAEGDTLVLDLAVYDDATVFDDLLLARRRAGAAMRSVPRLVRYRLEPGRADAKPEPLGVVIELMQVHPKAVGARRAAVCFGGGGFETGAFFDRTLRFDLETGAVQAWQRGNAVQLEPIFVPRPGGSADDDGVLIINTLADSDSTSQVFVLDARTLEPLAQVAAPQVLPFGFHGAFSAG